MIVISNTVITPDVPQSWAQRKAEQIRKLAEKSERVAVLELRLDAHAPNRPLQKLEETGFKKADSIEEALANAREIVWIKRGASGPLYYYYK